MTPLSNPITPDKDRLIKHRNSVERLFGLWKRIFPCLQKGLGNILSTTVNIIIVGAILHNISVEDFDELTVDAIEPRNSGIANTNDGMVLTKKFTLLSEMGIQKMSIIQTSKWNRNCHLTVIHSPQFHSHNLYY